MLFIENKTLSFSVNGPQRIELLESLQEKGFTPLIRTARLNCFDHALSGRERIGEMESAIASWIETENQEPYIRGDVFCLADHIFFLIFDDDTGEAPLLRAGIVYEASTAEPFRKLDAFCRDVREYLLTLEDPQPADSSDEDYLQWQHGKPNMPKGFKRFVAKQDIDSLYTSLRKETIRERIRAASMLEDSSARAFLRRAKEAHIEGYAARLLTGETIETPELSIEKLEEAGLVEREVQVSCRKTGHAMFRLPNAHALAVVTVSDAMCSECGSPVADERVEEVIAPSKLAQSLLEDGSWLVSRLHYFLREMGIPESEIAIGPSERDGHGQMMANICGESFLLVARDGELSPAFARRAIDLEIETEASHLVVVATGRVHNQARVLLQEHARRRVITGADFELILADGAAAGARELRYAFERVSQRVIAEQVCELDSFVGLSLSRIIITKFKLQRKVEEFGNPNLLNGESSSGTSIARRPLTLAARASTGDLDLLHRHESLPDEPSPGSEPDTFDDAETSLNSGTHG